jgi:hypothetical protein
MEVHFMKKILLLPLLATMALVSQAWGEFQACTGSYAGYCWWEESGCGQIGIDPGATWSMATCQEAYENCIQNSEDKKVYPSAACGTHVPGGDAKDMCMWNAAGDCWELNTSPDFKTVEDCIQDAWHFKGGTQGTGSYCAGGTFQSGKTNTPPTPGGNTVSLGCCKWSTGTKCWDIYTETEKTDCSGGANELFPGACPDKQGTCPSVSPIDVSGLSVGLTVLPSGNVLHIISERGATVELFSMNGAKVFSSKVAGGNIPLSLEKQKQGVYYAVVTSGSQKQTVKVILK